MGHGAQVTEHWAGLDWSDENHVVEVVTASGQSVASFSVANTPEGLEDLGARLQRVEQLQGVGIEATRALVMNWLVQHGFTVYAINPKLSAAWRTGVSVNNAKSDAADARIIARGVAQHHGELPVVVPDIPLARELALLCEDEVNWIEERTALVNRLTATLKMYFPVALEWFDDWSKPSAWRFVRKYSTAQALASANEQELVAFLKGHQMRYTRRRRELLN